MASYCQCEDGLTSARTDMARARGLHGSASNQASQADATLAAMGPSYAEVVATINDAVTADPSDTAWAVLKARVDKVLAERTDLKGTTEAAKLAYTKIVSHGAAAVAAKLNELV